ncbi:Mediator of DNA damage checkpoint protein 1 [Rhynchospora pubera]|uniref:Mediator of DNA damage checkpoint protein 1 n=1 Tax=Rhynchospora pubera TaxID=906938 RepID=A0AAV8E4L0_9POAL|nr:Mediator of DNA damage checkpoint protein 1 [Rhynchospora pubera]KAJ4778777.1 Mediator of DNA damage checkpoint protein 1 [Rhynchospora pubera]
MRLLWTVTLVLAGLYSSVSPAVARFGVGDGGFIAGGRSLLAFVEAQGNISFRCSPSGPCIPCQYSEKNDEKYRCSETGYHLPLKCVEVQDKTPNENNNNRRRLASLGNIEFLNSKLLGTISNFKWRKLLDESSSQSSEAAVKQYITYRSCVPIDGEERVSVLGFEVMMVGLLLVSGPVVYLRQRRTVLMQGAARTSSNSPRF